MKRTVVSIAAALAGYVLSSGTASAVTCQGNPAGGSPNYVYANLSNTDQCVLSNDGNDPAPADLSVFGKTWDFLDKQDNSPNDSYEGALKLTFDGGSTGQRLSGSWEIVNKNGFSDFVLAVKPDGEVFYFHLTGTSGTWNTNSQINVSPCPADNNCSGFGLSHMSLYGRKGGGDQPLPEPGSLALLGLGLIGLGAARRRSRD
jgi:hypothetical protein